jgi:hypothetical protein
MNAVNFGHGCLALISPTLRQLQQPQQQPHQQPHQRGRQPVRNKVDDTNTRAVRTRTFQHQRPAGLPILPHCLWRLRGRRRLSGELFRKSHLFVVVDDQLIISRTKRNEMKNEITRCGNEDAIVSGRGSHGRQQKLCS